MYEYAFKKIERDLWGSEPFKEDLRRIILEFGNEGWDFVQVFSPPGKNRFSEFAEVIMMKYVGSEEEKSRTETELSTIKIGSDQFGTEFAADYHQFIQEQGEEGWKLKQIFAPSLKTYGADYYELFFVK